MPLGSTLPDFLGEGPEPTYSKPQCRRGSNHQGRDSGMSPSQERGLDKPKLVALLLWLEIL